MVFKEAQEMLNTLGTLSEALRLHKEDLQKSNKPAEEDLVVFTSHALKHVDQAHAHVMSMTKDLMKRHK